MKIQVRTKHILSISQPKPEIQPSFTDWALIDKAQDGTLFSTDALGKELDAKDCLLSESTYVEFLGKPERRTVVVYGRWG